MRDCLKLLKKFDRIAIFSHINPDPDAIGSALALYNILKKMNKKVGLFCSGNISSDYNFLNDFSLYNTTKLQDYDLFVGVDVASDNMLGDFAEDFKNAANTLRIDHHISGNNYAKVNFVKNYSACAILIYQIAEKLKVKMDSTIATCLYFAICGDTGIFRNSNTDSLTFEISAKLLDRGADAKFVYSEFFDKKTVPFVKLSSKCLLEAELDKNGNFAIMSASSEDYKSCNADSTVCISNVPNTYLSCGYKMVVILKEIDGKIRCSLRSKVGYDCCAVAEKFGGGGHKNAAGCDIGGNLISAKKAIKRALNEYFKN